VNLTQKLEQARVDRDAVADRLQRAQEAMVDAESRRRDFSLKSALGDSAALKAMRAATTARDDLQALIEDLTIAIESADARIAAAERDVILAAASEARRALLELVAERLKVLDRIAKREMENWQDLEELKRLRPQFEVFLRVPEIYVDVRFSNQIWGILTGDNVKLARLVAMHMPWPVWSEWASYPVPKEDLIGREREMWGRAFASKDAAA